jgi:hypothetical protein
MNKHQKRMMKRKEKNERLQQETEGRDRKERNIKIVKWGSFIAILAVLALLFFNGAFLKESGVLEINPEMKDIGVVDRREGVKVTTFDVKNIGEGNLKLNSMVTSCMCTQATIIKDGEESPKFGMAGHGTNPVGWSQVLEPGEEALLKVYYDPNVHPELTGPVRRGITIFSSEGKKEVSIKLKQV